MGIFTKKEENREGENKYKGWGNAKEKMFDSDLQEYAVTQQAGGDLKGKDFRQLKRSVNKQRRMNERALRKAKRKGGDAEDYGFKQLNRKEQMTQDYFEDLGKERRENIGEAALIAAAVVATAGLAAPVLGVGGGAAAATGAAGATGAGAAGATAATGAAATGATASGVAATSAGTTAAIEAGKQIAKKAAKKAVVSGVTSALSGGQSAGQSGTQGALPPDPRLAQLEQQIAQLQAGPFGFTPQASQAPPPPSYQFPMAGATPSYTAGQVYDPFLGGYDEYMANQ